jgi:stress-induced morphogen
MQQMRISIEAIIKTLKSHLPDDAVLQVIDESQLHYGHAGYNQEIGVTHVAITLTWKVFKGVKQLERQRTLNLWLADLFKVGLHAVSYTLKAPGEANSL